MLLPQVPSSIMCHGWGGVRDDNPKKGFMNSGYNDKAASHLTRMAKEGMWDIMQRTNIIQSMKLEGNTELVFMIKYMYVSK